MYDVLYLDQASHCSVLGSRLNKESAAQLARSEARGRHAARMFLSGSAFIPKCQAVLVVKTGP